MKAQSNGAVPLRTVLDEQIGRIASSAVPPGEPPAANGCSLAASQPYHGSNGIERSATNGLHPRSNGGPPPSGDTGSGPTLDEQALYGLPGEVVRTIAPETEADPAALLLHFLCSFGSAAGSGPHVPAGGAEHPGRLYVCIVGESARARKGTASAEIAQVMRRADPEWARQGVSGMSSGEGLIRHATRCPAGHGLLVREPEFVRVLKAAARDGSTLSPVLRQAWDGGDLRVMTKEPVSASGAHISIAADITIEELRAYLRELPAANGFANRFLFVFARRSKLLPHGGKLGDEEVTRLAEKVKVALEKARGIGPMRRSSEGDRVWADYYSRLAGESAAGLLGGIVSRGEAQLLRLSVVYAAADGSATIEQPHLHAAWAVWRYCRESAELVFGDRLGDPMADKVLGILRKATGGTLKRSELHRAFPHVPASDLDRALELLKSRGLVTVTRQETAGRWGELVVLMGS